MNKTIYEEGIEEGIERGMVEGIERGMERGRAEGMDRGLERGLERGRERELIDFAVNVLEDRFGPLPAKILADLKSRSRQELRSMITNSYRITSLDALDFDGLK